MKVSYVALVASSTWMQMFHPLATKRMESYTWDLDRQEDVS